jgi:methyltransferase (TIGR00027 family)
MMKLETKSEKKEASIEDVSDTALWVATYRAQETERSDALFHDRLASVLVGDRGRKIAKDMMNTRFMAWVMVVRTTAIDQLIQQSIQMGVDTVLNLGAGLDTRPYRMNLPSSLRWVEVDFPHMMELKNQKLQKEKPVCQLERVSLDLSNRVARQTFFSQLASQSKKTLVITEGVIPYLSNQEAGELAQDLFQQHQFQYWIQDYLNNGMSRGFPSAWKKKLRAAPFRFQVKDWFQYFAQFGWVEKTKITAIEESKRIHRPFPFVFPWAIFFVLLAVFKQKEFNNRFGYILLTRKGNSAI